MIRIKYPQILSQREPKAASELKCSWNSPRVHIHKKWNIQGGPYPQIHLSMHQVRRAPSKSKRSSCLQRVLWVQQRPCTSIRCQAQTEPYNKKSDWFLKCHFWFYEKTRSHLFFIVRLCLSPAEAAARLLQPQLGLEDPPVVKRVELPSLPEEGGISWYLQFQLTGEFLNRTPTDTGAHLYLRAGFVWFRRVIVRC